MRENTQGKAPALGPGMAWEPLGGGHFVLCDGENRVTADPLLLAAFLPERPAWRVLDIGCGNGVIPLALHRRGFRRLAGVEIDAGALALARAGARRSGAPEIEYFCMDVRRLAPPLESGAFDAATLNPPYFSIQAGETGVGRRGEMRSERRLTAEEAFAAAARLLRPRGRLFFCHRPQEMPRWLPALTAAGFSLRRAQMVSHDAAHPPFLLLAEAVKGGARAGALQGEAALLLHDAAGRETPAAHAILCPEDAAQSPSRAPRGDGMHEDGHI